MREKRRYSSLLMTIFFIIIFIGLSEIVYSQQCSIDVQCPANYGCELESGNCVPSCGYEYLPCCQNSCFDSSLECKDNSCMRKGAVSSSGQQPTKYDGIEVKIGLGSPNELKDFKSISGSNCHIKAVEDDFVGDDEESYSGSFGNIIKHKTGNLASAIGTTCSESDDPCKVLKQAWSDNIRDKCGNCELASGSYGSKRYRPVGDLLCDGDDWNLCDSSFDGKTYPTKDNLGKTFLFRCEKGEWKEPIQAGAEDCGDSQNADEDGDEKRNCQDTDCYSTTQGDIKVSGSQSIGSFTFKNSQNENVDVYYHPACDPDVNRIVCTSQNNPSGKPAFAFESSVERGKQCCGDDGDTGDNKDKDRESQGFKCIKDNQGWSWQSTPGAAGKIRYNAVTRNEEVFDGTNWIYCNTNKFGQGQKITIGGTSGSDYLCVELSGQSKIIECCGSDNCKSDNLQNAPGKRFKTGESVKPLSFCGNGKCEISETESSCSSDCSRPSGIKYQAEVTNEANPMQEVIEGYWAGTKGSSKDLERLKLTHSASHRVEADICIRPLNSGSACAWQGWKSLSDGVGPRNSNSIKKIRLRLIGEPNYRIKYRVHIGNVGDYPQDNFFYDGEIAGVDDNSASKNIQAVQIWIDLNNDVFYCTQNKKFVNDLDASGLQSTCTAAGFTTTGTKCCSEDDDNRTIIETPQDICNPAKTECYNDQTGGCWNGTVIAPGRFVSGTQESVINLGGKFYGCHLTKYGSSDSTIKHDQDFNPGNNNLVELLDRHTGSKLIEKKEYCDVVQSYYCEYGDKWKLLGTSLSAPLHLSKAPEPIYTNLRHDFQRSKCCKQYECYDGTLNADGTPKPESCISNQKDNIETALSTNAAKGINDKVCIDGEWKTLSEKPKPNGDQGGYCPIDSQCYLGDSNRKCVDSGEISGLYFCNSGIWTTRVKLLADKMYRITQLNYKLFCDSKENSLPKRTGGSNLGINGENFCTLVSGNNNAVLLGSLLPSTLPMSPQIHRAFEFVACNDWYNSALDKNSFRPCASNANKLWYYKNLNAVLYSSRDLTSQQLSAQSPDLTQQKIQPIAQKFSINPNELEFNRLFLLEKNGKSITAFFDERSSSIFARYEGLGNICSTLRQYDAAKHPSQPERQISLIEENNGNVCFARVDLSDLGAHIDSSIWLDMTSKLRLT